jgi:hypothetical protein
MPNIRPNHSTLGSIIAWNVRSFACVVTNKIIMLKVKIMLVQLIRLKFHSRICRRVGVARSSQQTSDFFSHVGTINYTLEITHDVRL